MRFKIIFLIHLALASVSLAQLTMIDQNALNSGRSCVIVSKGSENSGYTAYCDGKKVIDLDGKFFWLSTAARSDRAKNLSEVLALMYANGYQLVKGQNDGDLLGKWSVTVVK